MSSEQGLPHPVTLHEGGAKMSPQQIAAGEKRFHELKRQIESRMGGGGI